MKTYTINAVLFDLDGVLVDSNIEIEKFWKSWALKEKIAFTKVTMEKHVLGRTTRETIKELFHTSSQLIKEKIYNDAADFDLKMQPELIKDADRFLKDVAMNLEKIALITSSPKIRAKKILEDHKIYNYFTCTVTGEDVTLGKPDPEPYLLAASKMNVNPDECLVFEDSNNGILSALAAGMYVVAVDNKMENEKIITRINNYTTLKVENRKIFFGDEMISLQLGN